MLDAQGVGTAVALGVVKDCFGSARLARPKRIPSFGSLLEIPVAKELFAGCTSLAGRRRQARPTTQTAQHKQGTINANDRDHKCSDSSLADPLAKRKKLSAVISIWCPATKYNMERVEASERFISHLTAIAPSATVTEDEAVPPIPLAVEAACLGSLRPLRRQAKALLRLV
jgi:hypothetical protein